MTKDERWDRAAQRRALAAVACFGCARRNRFGLRAAFKGDALVAPPTAGWPTNGGNWYNQRYSPLTEIDRGNVANLKGVWRTRLERLRRRHEVLRRGAADRRTTASSTSSRAPTTCSRSTSTAARSSGRTKRSSIAANDVVCCGWTSRGVGFGDGKVFVGQLDGKLVALDQKTGAVAWSVQAERWQDGFTITGAPLYYDGLVITGFAGAEYGIRGRVKAFDARDGKLAWTFYTIPGPGEIGHDTWPQDNDLWMHGGASVWQTPAVDPELGLIYFSTGNPGPDYNGGVRAGDNLFSASIVALDAKTGDYRWHFQQVHHDIWDYDGPSPVVLFDLAAERRAAQGLAQPSKTGWVYILDRTNGTPLVGIDERPVPQEPRQATAATQPYPRGDAFVPQSSRIAPEGFALVNGGKIFTPYWTDRDVLDEARRSAAARTGRRARTIPRRGYLYVCAQDRIGVFRADALDGGAAARRRALRRGHLRRHRALPNFGVFAALDMRTNKLVWQQHWSRCVLQRLDDDGRRARVRRPQRRPAHGARCARRQEALGISDGRRHERARQRFRARAASNTSSRTRPAICSRARRKATASGCSGSTARCRRRRPPGAAMLFTREAEGTADPAAGKIVYDTACMFCHGEQGEGGHGGGKALDGRDEPGL